MRRGLQTPLALAILTLLYERSMHPYEMQHLMRERAHDRVIKLRAGSLYSTIERLLKAGLISQGATHRQGRRPERTEYMLTPAGQQELFRWLRTLVAEPVHEYPWFGAALAFLAVLPADEALDGLQQRAATLARTIAEAEHDHRTAEQSGRPRLFGVEGEYLLAMRRAELGWVLQIIDDMHRGTLDWPAVVRRVHAAKARHAANDQPLTDVPE